MNIDASIIQGVSKASRQAGLSTEAGGKAPAVAHAPRAPKVDAHLYAGPPEPKTEKARPVQMDIERAVDSLSNANPQLSFAVDEGSNKVVVLVRDRESGEVIRQIPPEELLELARRIKEMQGTNKSTGFVFSKTT